MLLMRRFSGNRDYAIVITCACRNLSVPINKNELDRVQTLRDSLAVSSDINDVRFDAITALVGRTFDVLPFAFVVLF